MKKVLWLLLDDYIFTTKELKTLPLNNICYKITQTVKQTNLKTIFLNR